MTRVGQFNWKKSYWKKVSNNVLAVLQELADADAETIQQILNPQPQEA